MILRIGCKALAAPHPWALRARVVSMSSLSNSMTRSSESGGKQACKVARHSVASRRCSMRRFLVA